MCNNAQRVARNAPSGQGRPDRETSMEVAGIPLSPLVALIAGVLILVMPRLLNYIVAIYLIVVGLLGIFPQLAT
jgi:hypothetical protein